MNYAVLLSQTNEPAKVVPCINDDVLKECYRLIGCRTVQLVPAYDEDRLSKEYDALCDEDVYGKTVCLNPIASWIYGADIHGTGIHGNVVVLKVVKEEEEANLAFMPKEEAQALADKLNENYDWKYDQVLFTVLVNLRTE